jgi:hypothetical protein
LLIKESAMYLVILTVSSFCINRFYAVVRVPPQLFGRFKCYPICLRLNPEIRATRSKQFYFFTSTCIRRLFWFGRVEGAIEKMRSIFLFTLWAKKQKQRRCRVRSQPAVEANLRYTVLSELIFRTVMVSHEPPFRIKKFMMVIEWFVDTNQGSEVCLTSNLWQ